MCIVQKEGGSGSLRCSDALLERCEAASRAAGLPKPSYNVVLARNAAHTFVMMVPRSQVRARGQHVPGSAAPVCLLWREGV